MGAGAIRADTLVVSGGNVTIKESKTSRGNGGQGRGLHVLGCSGQEVKAIIPSERSCWQADRKHRGRIEPEQNVRVPTGSGPAHPCWQLCWVEGRSVEAALKMFLHRRWHLRNGHDLIWWQCDHSAV